MTFSLLGVELTKNVTCRPTTTEILMVILKLESVAFSSSAY